jgi:hypothetical protein
MQAGSLSVEKAEAKVAQEAPTFSRATPLQGVSVIAFRLGAAGLSLPPSSLPRACSAPGSSAAIARLRARIFRLRAFYDDATMHDMDAATMEEGHVVAALWKGYKDVGTVFVGPDDWRTRAMAALAQRLHASRKLAKSVLKGSDGRIPTTQGDRLAQEWAAHSLGGRHCRPCREIARACPGVAFALFFAHAAVETADDREIRRGHARGGICLRAAPRP